MTVIPQSRVPGKEHTLGATVDEVGICITTTSPSVESVPTPFVRRPVSKLQPDGSAIKCLLSDESSLTLSRFLAGFIRPSDQLEFDPTVVDPVRELRVVQNTSRRPTELYFAPIGYVTQPKPDKRDEYFVRAAVADSRLGGVSLRPCVSA